MEYKVLITGGSRGIGNEIVELFKEKGYTVFCPTRDELDLSNKSSVEEYINNNKDTGINIIINNAGINHINYLDSLDEQDVYEMIEVNLLSALRLIKGFAPYMREIQFGRIVNIGSIWDVISKPGRTGYSITKHGINGITKTLALELAKDGILVNTVSPGQTMTELTKKNNDERAIRQMEKDIPIGRLAKPSEIAKAVFFLANENNTYITGQELVVDGGLSVQ